MDYNEWINYGMEQGFVSPPVCATHDGLPMTEEEMNDEEPCVFVIRPYHDDDHRKAIEQAHAPSVWRR